MGWQGFEPTPRRLTADRLRYISLTMTRIYAEQVNSEDAIKAYKAVVLIASV